MIIHNNFMNKLPMVTTNYKLTPDLQTKLTREPYTDPNHKLCHPNPKLKLKCLPDLSVNQNTNILLSVTGIWTQELLFTQQAL